MNLLAAIWSKTVGEDAQRAASSATFAGGTEEHGAEAAPTLGEALPILSRSDGRDVLVLQAPKLIGQIAAPTRLGDEVEE